MKAVLLALLLVGCAQEGVTAGTEPLDSAASAGPSATIEATVPPTSSTSTTLPVTTLPSTTMASTILPSSTTITTIPAIAGIEEFPITGRRPHDVAVAPDGTVWYTAQRSGSLDRLDPETGDVIEVPLGSGAAPHGVIVGPEGHAWVTDQGLNAVVRVQHDTRDFEIHVAGVDVAMHTAAFAPDGILWFTGQQGYVGRLDPSSGAMDLFETGGGGPYGITVSPDGDVYFAALSGSYVGRVDPASGEITRLDPPTRDQGARRVWTDSEGSIWTSYWNTGHLARYDPANDAWTEWELPGESPQAYAVYVDETDRPWVSDFGGDHALLRFDPATEEFESVPLPTPGGEVRQLLGRPGEVWGAESAVDALVVVRYGDD